MCVWCVCTWACRCICLTKRPEKKARFPVLFSSPIPWDSISHWTWHRAGSQKTPVILLFLLPMVLGSQAHMVIPDSLLGYRDPDSADVFSACSSHFSRCLWRGSLLTHLECSAFPYSVMVLTCTQDAMHACLVLLLIFVFYWKQVGLGTVLGHLFAVVSSGTERPGWLLVEAQ